MATVRMDSDQKQLSYQFYQRAQQIVTTLKTALDKTIKLAPLHEALAGSDGPSDQKAPLMDIDDGFKNMRDRLVVLDDAVKGLEHAVADTTQPEKFMLTLDAKGVKENDELKAAERVLEDAMKRQETYSSKLGFMQSARATKLKNQEKKIDDANPEIVKSKISRLKAELADLQTKFHNLDADSIKRDEKDESLSPKSMNKQHDITDLSRHRKDESISPERPNKAEMKKQNDTLPPDSTEIIKEISKITKELARLDGLQPSNELHQRLQHDLKELEKDQDRLITQFKHREGSAKIESDVASAKARLTRTQDELKKQIAFQEKLYYSAVSAKTMLACLSVYTAVETLCKSADEIRRPVALTAAVDNYHDFCGVTATTAQDDPVSVEEPKEGLETEMCVNLFNTGINLEQIKTDLTHCQKDMADLLKRLWCPESNNQVGFVLYEKTSNDSKCALLESKTLTPDQAKIIVPVAKEKAVLLLDLRNRLIGEQLPKALVDNHGGRSNTVPTTFNRRSSGDRMPPPVMTSPSAAVARLEVTSPTNSLSSLP